MLCFVLLYFSSDRVEQCQDSLPKAHCFLTVQVMTSQCSTIDNFSPRVLSALQMHFTILLLPAITLFPYWPLPQSEHVAEQKKKESEAQKKIVSKNICDAARKKTQKHPASWILYLWVVPGKKWDSICFYTLRCQNSLKINISNIFISSR